MRIGELAKKAGFATPWTFAFLYSIFVNIDSQLGIPGSFATLDHTHIMFANLMGSVVIVWSVIRLKVNTVIMGRGDMAARFLFASWQIYAVASGASWLILGFTAIEIVFGILQALPVSEQNANRDQRKEAYA